jgi:hypothetical protein
MRSWFRARDKSQEATADETLIRVCLVSRDPALVEEVHKDLLVGFSTRGGYEFESDHPDFQRYCDVLFVDLRAAGVQGDPKEGLDFIDAIRKSVSHPPIVALCDADTTDLAREAREFPHAANRSPRKSANCPEAQGTSRRARLRGRSAAGTT